MKHWNKPFALLLAMLLVMPAFAADKNIVRLATTTSTANSGLLDLTALSVAISPRFAEDRTAFVGTASGLYRSRNGGRSWREVVLGVVGEQEAMAVQVLAVSPNFGQDKLVLAGTEAHGLLRSDDGGARFAAVPELADHGISALAFSPDGTSVVVAAGSRSMARGVPSPFSIVNRARMARFQKIWRVGIPLG